MARARPTQPPPSLLYLGDGRALYVGSALDTGVHAHHAVQVCITLGGVCRVRAGTRGRWRAHDAVVIPADLPHQLDAGAGTVALLYLDPERLETRTLNPRTPVVIQRARVAPLHARLAACAGAAPDPAALDALCDDVAAAVFGRPGAAAPLDDRVREAIAFLRTVPGKAATATAVGERVALSPSRLGHLFSRTVGLPLRRYLLWLRLQDALGEMAAGASVTDAAHGAGFADGAHLSRTCRRMFGVTPSGLQQVSQFVQAAPPVR